MQEQEGILGAHDDKCNMSQHILLSAPAAKCEMTKASESKHKRESAVKLSKKQLTGSQFISSVELWVGKKGINYIIIGKTTLVRVAFMEKDSKAMCTFGNKSWKALLKNN